ncbi:PREDICTED: glycogen synthase kinase-3-like, partial [Rhagoletis zephyria]|uniref:glycogen synthase kinase-3-like n=1 Tax=Rhagoletis zephyria TaxID=28612 RepID=UPI0008119A33
MARSVPVGNGFGPNGAAAEAEPPSGAFPPIGSLGASIAAYQPVLGQPQQTLPQPPQRHNSGAIIGSTDSLALHANGNGPSLQTAAVSSSMGVEAQQQPQQQRSQSYYINQLPVQLQSGIEPPAPITTPITINAYSLHGPELVTLVIRNENFFDRGAFGTVFQARLINQDNRRVAVKTVLQDKRYRNRELPLMKSLTHPNIVTLFYYYFSTRSADPRGDKCLNLVMEFMPSNVSHLIPRKPKQRDPNSIPNTPLAVKVVMYQIFRALSYIHLNGICHRDIKPNNLLFNHADGVLKVCDFGSAKRLVPGERNVSYICARYYRAPELLFGATNYTNMIDLWSAGIVFSELLLGFPIFYESSGIDQLVNIISKLGTPKTEEIQAMNKDYVKFNLPEVPRIPLRNLFANNVASISEVTLDLIGQLFQYDPQKRIRPLDACAHPYFDELRDPSKKWVNGRELPRLFNFTEE